MVVEYVLLVRKLLGTVALEKGIASNRALNDSFCQEEVMCLLGALYYQSLRKQTGFWL